ncbi:hypothetical protein Dimus_004451 [Dionaea muscipula]
MEVCQISGQFAEFAVDLARIRKAMLGARSSWLRLSKCLRILQRRTLCKTTGGGGGGGVGSKQKIPDVRELEAYRDLEKLDFMKAAKILFADSPKKKKFGIDFHLVQLFFACLPSLAVYLVAQYARHDMKKMDAELELKKKAEEEKAKEIEANAAKQKMESNPELLKVKERLEALEETVKEIVVETKKQTGNTMSKNPDANADNSKDRTTVDAPKPQEKCSLEETTPISGPREKDEPVAAADAKQQDQGGDTA